MNTGSSEKSDSGITTLLMGFHCHQPVGNFDSVIRRGCEICYGPLLEELCRHESFKFSIHMSGHLLEWIQSRERGIFDMLSLAARRGQAEIFTAGFYEPVLTVIPPSDALEQIRLLSDLAFEMSGRRPEGLWLTERIWDPFLVPLLCEAGVRYTIVDDNHLLASGQGGLDLTGHFITETQGQPMGLYPISQRLRYATPFKPVKESLDAVIQAGAGKGRTAIVFDDGEKFGMWPGTSQWVYGSGWLRDFLTAVCESEDIRTATFSEHYHSRTPLGRVHLASGSYVEMEEWALSPGDAGLFHELARELESSGRGDAARKFLRGGLWPDFFIKYSESNNMHKKMIRISRRSIENDVPEARRPLFQGQCNDAYWHGIFGGLYLPVLRNGVKRALNEAEGILDDKCGVPSPLLEDINLDGHPEAELRSSEMVAVVTAMGGTLYELSDKKSFFDLLGTLTRRPEHYHTVSVQDTESGEAAVATIHESMHSMTEEVRKKIVYDPYPRHAFLDHFMPSETRAGEWMDSRALQWGDFATGLYELKIEGRRAVTHRKGTLSVPGSNPLPLTVQKRFELEGRTLAVDYELSCPEQVEGDVAFGCEVNLHPPSQAGCKADVDGKPFSLEDCLDWEEGRCVTLQDPLLPAPLRLRSSVPAALWAYPVRTVSQSEGGFEVTWQGYCIGFKWRLGPGSLELLSFRLTLEF